jgi:hypothetical protein
MKAIKGSHAVIEASIMCLIASTITIMLSSTFFSHYDYTDEGIYHYLLSWGPESFFLSPFHILIHYIGKLWSHHIAGYRFFNLGLITLANFFLINSLRRFLQSTAFLQISKSLYWLVAGLLQLTALFHYSAISTLGYDSLSYASTCIWVGAFLRLIHTSDKPKDYFPALSFLVIGAFFAFTARPPFGAILAVYTVILFPIFSRYFCLNYGIRKILHFSLALWILYFLYFISFTESINDMIAEYAFELNSSHGNIFGRIGNQWYEFWSPYLSKFLPRAILFGFSIGVLARTYLKKQNWPIVLLLTAGLLPLFYLSYKNYWIQLNRGTYTNFHQAILISINFGLISYITIAGNPKIVLPPLLSASFLSLLAVFSSGLGTNSSIFEHAGFGMSLIMLPLLASLITIISQRQFRFLSFPLAALCLLGLLPLLYHSHFVDYYRDHPSPRGLSTTSSVISGVAIREDFANSIDAANHYLNKVGFDRKKDKLLIYPDFPGFGAALQVKAFGHPWLHTQYPNSEWKNCLSMQQDVINHHHQTQYIYFLLGQPLETIMENCKKILLEPAGKISVNKVASGRHTRNGNTYNLILEGPYKIKKTNQFIFH